MATVDSVLREALSLAPGDRELVARRLIQSIDDDLIEGEQPDPAVAAAWAAEIERRAAEPDDDAMDWEEARRLIFRKPV